MGTRRDSNRQKQAEKKKKSREDARTTRGSRPGPGGAPVDPGVALRWPVGECYLSDNWPDQGARVAAVFTRRSRGGRVAIALFDVDLAEEGVVAADLRAGSDFDLQSIVSRLSIDGRSMVVREPSLVVKLVRAGAEHGRSLGHAPHGAYARCSRVFGDVDPAKASDEIKVGTEPSANPPPKPAGEGLFARLRRKVLGG